MSTRTKLTAKKKARFLELLSETANVTYSAAMTPIARTWVYQLRKEDPEFAAAWDEAQELGTRALEDEAIRRAKEGWDEPVFYQGVQCGVQRKFSDTLLIFMLKARDPKYRDRSALELSGPNGTPIESRSAVTVEEAAQKYRELLGRS